MFFPECDWPADECPPTEPSVHSRDTEPSGPPEPDDWDVWLPTGTAAGSENMPNARNAAPTDPCPPIDGESEPIPRIPPLRGWCCQIGEER